MWQKIPMWAKTTSAIVGGFASLWLVFGWAGEAYKHFETAEHHSEDVQLIMKKMYVDEIADRIQRNQREIKRLERDFIAGRYTNNDERDFIKDEITFLKARITNDQDLIDAVTKRTPTQE